MSSQTKCLVIALLCLALSHPTSLAAQQPAATNDNTALTLSASSSKSQVVLSPAAFKALPHKTIAVHNSHTNADETYSGVPLMTLLAKLDASLGQELHGKAFASYIIATGSDGYRTVLALAEADPSIHPGEVLVADSMNARPLDAHAGPFILIVSQDTRPARWVRNLVSIEFRSLN